MTDLQIIALWLETEAAKLTRDANGRRSSARAMRTATPAELRAAKATAEKMHGRKLPGVSASVESARADANMNDSIAAKLETEARQLSKWADEITRIHTLINTPELVDFPKAVHIEAVHQRERWGSEHDAGKQPEDWFWLIGYLAGKALQAAKADDTEKLKHHIVTTAAALNNWHAQILGASDMRPGISAEKQAAIDK